MEPHRHYSILYRSNKSRTLDLSQPAKRDILRESTQVSDILTENFTPRAMRGWGLDYPNASKLNPGPVMLSCSTTSRLVARAGNFAEAIGIDGAFPGAQCLIENFSLCEPTSPDWPTGRDGAPKIRSGRVVCLRQ